MDDLALVEMLPVNSSTSSLECAEGPIGSLTGVGCDRASAHWLGRFHLLFAFEALPFVFNFGAIVVIPLLDRHATDSGGGKSSSSGVDL
jgi:hypothetical protein